MFRSLVAVVFVLLFAACSNDFTLEAPYRDIPVVYGFISIQDTAHYVRVEKAFLPAGGDARQAARNPDSLYYDEGEVTVRLTNLRSGSSVVLDRVNGELEGLPRQEGIFANSPNILYKARPAALGLRGGDRVRLTVERAGQDTARAEATMLGAIQLLESRPSDPARIVEYDRNTNISWQAGEEAVIFDLQLVFHLREFFPADPSQNRERSLVWNLAKGQTADANSELTNYTLRNERIFQFLRDTLEERDDVLRVFDGFDLVVAGGGAEIRNFLQVANANIGLTSSQQIPTYTNVTNGLGLFSSRYMTRREDIDIDMPSQDSLRTGVYTRELNFQ